jgi:hypothetical protein
LKSDPSKLSLSRLQAQLLDSALLRSMSTRVGLLRTPPAARHYPSACRLGVLFSGGIDCMVLALLAHKLLPKQEPIDLINVAFCGEPRKESINKSVPDRITSITGWRELNRCSEKDAADQAAAAGSSSNDRTVSRRWNLIHVNVSLRMLERHRADILSLMQPTCSVMDFNIASVLRFDTMGRGVLYEEPAGIDGIDTDPSAMNDRGLIQSSLSRLGPAANSIARTNRRRRRRSRNGMIRARELRPRSRAKLGGAMQSEQAASMPAA